MSDMKKCIFSLFPALLLLMALNGTGLNADTDSGIQILLPGPWHGDEVHAHNGQRFRAIRAIEEPQVPLPVRLKIRRFHDPIVDGGSDEKTGKDVGIHRPVKQLSFLIRGMKFSPEQRVRSVAFAGSGKLKLNRSLRFQGLNREPVEIRFGKSPRGAALTVTGPAGKQTLAAYKIDAHKSPQVIWVGDLDGDNRLDLLLDVSNHYNVSEYTLFLSSQRGKNPHVGKAAVFRTTGC